MNYWDLLPAEIIVHISDTLQDGDFKALNQTYGWIRDALRDRTILRSRSITESSRKGILEDVIFRCGLFNLNPSRGVTFKKIKFKFPNDHYDIPHLVTYFYDVGETENLPQGLYLKCLMNACQNGHLNIVKYLVERYLKPEVMNNWAVKLAIGNGHVNVAAYLPGLPQVNSLLYHDSVLRLGLASKNGHIDMVRYICEQYKERLSQDDFRIGFRAACEFGQLPVALFLGTLVNHKDYCFGLERATANDQPHIVRSLIPKASKEEINQIFVKSCLYGLLNIVQDLLTNPEIRPVIDPDFGDNRALKFLVIENSDYVSILEYLIQVSFLKTCADPSAVYNNLFVEACKSGSMKCVTFLISSVPEVQPDYLQNQALLRASHFGRFKVVKFLLTGCDNGPFPGVMTCRSLKQAMNRAVKWYYDAQHFEIIKMLSKYPDAEAGSDKHLLKSVTNGSRCLVQFLIQLRKRRAKSGLTEVVSETLLTSLFQICSRSGYYEIYKILVSVPSKNETGNRELSFKSACFRGHTGLIKVILDERTQNNKSWALDVSMKNNDCLIQAISCQTIFYYLVNLQNLDGSDRVDFARDNHALLSNAFSAGQVNMVRFLLRTRSMRGHRRHFIVKFIRKAFGLFTQFTLGLERKLTLFGPVWSYIMPLRQRYVAYLSGPATKKPDIVSDAWKFLDEFRQQLLDDYQDLT